MLFYREKGHGTPIVFIHAYLLDSRYWLDQITGLSDEFRCIAPDLRGHGPHNPDEIRRHIQEEDDADDILALIEQTCGTEPLHLVGFSAGGIIAGLVYRKIPNQVKSIALLSTNFLVELDATYKRYQAELARNVVVEGLDTLFRRFDEYIIGSGADLIARARYKTMLRDQSFELIIAFLTGDAIQARPEIPGQLDVPVFLPYGDEDVAMRPEMLKRLLNQYPNATAHAIPNSGRLLPLESPKALNESLREFWRGL